MHNLKKLVALTLSALCLTSVISSSTALADTTTTPGQVSSSAILTSSALKFDVTVPTSVLIYLNSAGDTITPDHVSIINNSSAPVVVSSLAVNTEGGWTLDKSDTDYSKYKVGHKNFSMLINGQDPANGAFAINTPINGSSTLDLPLSASVAPQKDSISTAKIGSIVVTMDWYSNTGASYPVGYVLATDADFSGSSDGWFKYTGSADYVVIPEKIKGIQLTSYKEMFSGTAVKGVISTNPNITDFRRMFANATSPTLELDLNTSNATDLSYMFWGTNAANLDLSKFNTSKVVDINHMFYDCKASNLVLTGWDTSNITEMSSAFNSAKAVSLDLSSWDTSKANTYAMLFNSVATTGYARTQADADRLNDTFNTNKPAGLTFTVK